MDKKPLRLWIIDNQKGINNGRSKTYFITDLKSLSIIRSAYEQGYIISFKCYNKQLCVYAKQFNIVGGFYGD